MKLLKILIVLTLILSVLISGCTDNGDDKNNIETDYHMQCSINLFEKKLNDCKIESFIWLDEENLLIKTNKNNNTQLWKYNIIEDFAVQIFDLYFENNYYISRVEKNDKGYNITEFGGNFYEIENDILISYSKGIANTNDYEVFVDIKDGNIYYYDFSERNLISKNKILYSIPASDNMNYPRHISISPDNNLLSFSCLGGEYNIEKNITIDLINNNIEENKVDLIAPYFLWIDNRPAYIDISNDNSIVFYFPDNQENIKIELEGQGYFSSELYNLGVQKNKLLFVGKGDKKDIVYIIDLKNYDIKRVYSQDNELCSTFVLSPECTKIAILTCNVKDFSNINLVIKTIE